jgi:integrase
MWKWSTGSGPNKVTALEMPNRRSVLYLRWRANGNWAVESLKESCRTDKGRLIQAACDRAKDAARAKSTELMGNIRPVSTPVGTYRDSQHVTLYATSDLVFHPETGVWSEGTAHGKEIKRSLDFAMSVWGAEKPWTAVTRADWRLLWRRRMATLQAAGKRGNRMAEVVVQRLVTMAEWLVDEGHVLRVEKPERKWKEAIAADYIRMTGADPVVHRPRHSLEEMRQLLAASQQADPRFRLLLVLGAELRLGQVARCRRSDLNLDEWTLTVRGRGKKQGTVVHLTAVQRAEVQQALAGYLQRLDRECVDYPLFPQGQMPGGRKGAPVADPDRHGFAKPVGRRWILAQFRACETRAGIPHVEGRGAYGVKRAAVDGVKREKISREALKEFGGWADTQIPDMVYADAQAEYARAEAALLRARIRNEPEESPNA